MVWKEPLIRLRPPSPARRGEGPWTLMFACPSGGVVLFAARRCEPHRGVSDAGGDRTASVSHVGSDAFDWMARSLRRSTVRALLDAFERIWIDSAVMGRRTTESPRPLWAAAFLVCAGVFLSITLLFQWLPPTATGGDRFRTIERYSKFKDYLAAALFFLSFPPLTVWFRTAAAAPGRDIVEVHSFTPPLFLSPLLYLTTGKVAGFFFCPWPRVRSGPRAAFYRSRRWLSPVPATELTRIRSDSSAKAAWIVYRYIATVADSRTTRPFSGGGVLAWFLLFFFRRGGSRGPPGCAELWSIE